MRSSMSMMVQILELWDPSFKGHERAMSPYFATAPSRRVPSVHISPRLVSRVTKAQGSTRHSDGRCSRIWGLTGFTSNAVATRSFRSIILSCSQKLCSLSPSIKSFSSNSLCDLSLRRLPPASRLCGPQGVRTTHAMYVSERVDT